MTDNIEDRHTEQKWNIYCHPLGLPKEMRTKMGVIFNRKMDENLS